MRHQREVLDQPASFSFRRVARTQHAPLTGLQRAGATDLARLLELGRDSGHHPESRDERKPAENMRYASSVHLEPFEGPVPCGYRTHKARSDMIPLELHRIERIEFART